MAALHTLIAQKADVNAAQVDGATALHWAVYRQDLKRSNCDQAARADTKNREGIASYMVPFMECQDRRGLIKAGADVKQKVRPRPR
jgi:ankyrin repeat protein